MRIGVSTASFYPRVNTEDTLDIMRDLGFNLCEAFLETESESSEDYAFVLSERAKALGVEIYSVHAFSSVFEPFLYDAYDRRRKEMEDKFTKVCRAASVLGAKYYTFHGMKNMPGKKINISKVSRQMDYLCEIAEGYGVKVSIENVARCKGSNIDFLKDLKQHMIKNLYYTLDLKQARLSGVDPYEYLKVYGDNISTVHINDASETSPCLLPGEGNANLKEIIQKIHSINKNIPYIIEVYGDNYESFNQIGRAREHLESLEVLNVKN
ncbi:sugar phosphate isomerase/epimerase family protein [Clostridium cylindrosporum]|uniref:Sugar phosphate isomerase/epimerase n=1 Tax=Clostridium cylindrosporum DSM 605 TaxID=1121307 RepID=A0A0J8DF15_CLOCY|nr:sugar phosphate isomerase/epimerase [Clostridium cylindrosporum]KMT22763.1 sugar phosphate isomerase/epimerase [Clostridium cylindrosporum DSM 605]